MEKNVKRKRGRPRKKPELPRELPSEPSEPQASPLPLPEEAPLATAAAAPTSNGAGNSSGFEQVAAEIEAKPDPGGTPATGAAGAVPEATLGWTAKEVSENFSALLLLATIARGEHWQIAEDDVARLGERWLPIFRRHIPYNANYSAAMEWVFAVTATIGILKVPLKVEWEKYQASRQVGTVRDGLTAGSAESSAISGSPEPAKPTEWAPQSAAVGVQSFSMP